MKDVNALYVCVIITRVMLECRCPDIRLEQDANRAFRVLCKTRRPNSEASYVGRVLLFLVYVTDRVHSAKTCVCLALSSSVRIGHKSVSSPSISGHSLNCFGLFLT